MKEENLPRAEYPRPQFMRDDWMNLNGIWDFEFDDLDEGLKKHWESDCSKFSKEINVPFAYQTKLSGLSETIAHDIVWYKRYFSIPEEWKNRQLLLHFGAVDYKCMVWINGKLAGTHEGGHSSFEMNITDCLSEDNYIVVRAEDYMKDVSLPRGKQYWETKSKSIFYTGTTGIWQSVWIEPVNEIHLEQVTFTPDIDHNLIHIGLKTSGKLQEKSIRIQADVSFTGSDAVREYEQIPITSDTYQLSDNWEYRSIGLHNFHHEGYEFWWTPERPNLYDIVFTLLDGEKVLDKVKCYFGMRKISVQNGVLCLNNRPYKQRLVLDQGYFPQGGLTAPTDEDLKKDIILAKKMGFNGARKHQKVEDPRWLYWCDKLGYLVWGEMADAYVYTPEYAMRMMKEWMEVIKRDYSHPCIVAWVPLNESWGIPNVKVDECQQSHAKAMYYITKSLDNTRPVMSNDGWEHVHSDICTIHDYEPKEQVLRQRYASVTDALKFKSAGRELYVGDASYKGEPIMVTEFGGIAFQANEEGWGYSSASSQEDYIERLKAVFRPLHESEILSGFCYTQLTDVEQEENGLLTYDRKEKIPLEIINEIVRGI